MNAIQEQLRSPVFWFATVAVALLVNLLTSYLVRVLDRSWLKGRTALSERAKASQTAKRQRVSEMAKNINFLRYQSEKVHHARFFALALLILTFAVDPRIDSRLYTTFIVLMAVFSISAMFMFVWCNARTDEITDAYKLRDMAGEHS
jgi:hypothetical protein